MIFGRRLGVGWGVVVAREGVVLSPSSCEMGVDGVDRMRVKTVHKGLVVLVLRGRAL
jgi:hypothetical protein